MVWGRKFQAEGAMAVFWREDTLVAQSTWTVEWGLDGAWNASIPEEVRDPPDGW